jgi:hypothetical protein
MATKVLSQSDGEKLNQPVYHTCVRTEGWFKPVHECLLKNFVFEIVLY